jgi:hypothetical protein
VELKEVAVSSMKTVAKELRPAVRRAIADGWVIEFRKKGHIKLSKKGCGCVFLSATPSDRRVVKHFICDIRRASERVR